MILNRYVINNVKVGEIKDEFNPYFIEHSKKNKFFTVSILFKIKQ